MEKYIFLSLLTSSLVIGGVNGRSVARDKQSDVTVIPHGFDYKNVLSAEESRAVQPEPEVEESVVKFRYGEGTGNGIGSTSLIYSSGGNATLELINGENDTYPLYKTGPDSDRNYNLQAVVIPLLEPDSSVMTRMATRV